MCLWCVMLGMESSDKLVFRLTAGRDEARQLAQPDACHLSLQNMKKKMQDEYLGLGGSPNQVSARSDCHVAST